MSSIFGSFGATTAPSQSDVRAVLGAMEARGRDKVDVWRDRDAVIAVSRYDWEMGPEFSSSRMVAEDERLVVATDATLYYRDDLRRALAAHGVSPASDMPADLILAAFRAWGEDCANELEGDFSFLVFDRKARSVLCCRDPGGKRPLHYALLGRELVVASTIAGVAAHPRCPRDLNVPLIGATAAGLLWSAGPETCYQAVRVLPQASRLAWVDGRLRGPTPFWAPPVEAPESSLSHDEAAEALLELLRAATRERLDPGAPTTVWMSGGWDSTAVFAAAHAEATAEPSLPAPRPVSISYPEGDPGREDELIREVAGHADADVHWIDIADIPFLDDEPAHAARRDEPYAHLYGNWNTALAEGSRRCGGRVALDGNGGDQLFQNTDVFLADLFREGRWPTLAREWKSRSRGGAREFFASVVQPTLPPWALRAAATIRGGRRLRHYLERKIPAWIEPTFAARERLAERDLDYLAPDLPVSLARREIAWQFTSPFISRAFSLLGGFALSRGVELRSPLADRRIIKFALSRPWWERSSGRETKYLLRRAMRGLLPPSILAPRERRTGITSGYSHRWMMEAFPALLRETLARPMMLEELGVIRAESLRKASEQYRWEGDAYTRVNMFYTLQAELWLRAASDRRTIAARETPLHEDRPQLAATA